MKIDHTHPNISGATVNQKLTVCQTSHTDSKYNNQRIQVATYHKGVKRNHMCSGVVGGGGNAWERRSNIRN